MSTARVEMNVREGTVSIEAPVEAIEGILGRLEVFLPRLTEAARPAAADPLAEESPEERPAQAPSTHTAPGPPAANGAGKAKRGSKKPESYTMVNLGLSREQIEEFQGFYAEKKPQGQSQQVLTVMYWLLKRTARTTLSKDEIFTGLRTVKERVPGRLTSVLSNLKLDGQVVPEGEGFVVHHTGEDFVERDLPAAVKK